MRCENGHSFDVAREGYVNLLVGKRRVGAAAGDTATMVAARRAFLQRGFYEPLVQELATSVNGGLAHNPGAVVDVGCGEGFYLGELVKKPALANMRAYGTDISKPAIAMAAKAHPEIMFAVADTNQLIPLAGGAVDVLLDVFAPRNAAEFMRIVRPGGRAVIVIPGDEHLASLRERFRLLAIERDKAAKIAAQLEDFELMSSRRVSVQMQLDGQGLRDLLEMTPNAWFMNETTRGEISNVNDISTEACFEVLVFTRRG